mmetsp:Transcript_15035/g.40327  ORF Transcript_15035/g.40327 Transcript_15035/m.40327 type:complete len:82 (-) Transcript_15035:631-876(-)
MTARSTSGRSLLPTRSTGRACVDFEMLFRGCTASERKQMHHAATDVPVVRVDLKVLSDAFCADHEKSASVQVVTLFSFRHL